MILDDLYLLNRDADSRWKGEIVRLPSSLDEVVEVVRYRVSYTHQESILTRERLPLRR